MTKLNLSLGILFIGTVTVAANFAACSKSSNSTGTAGASGSAGTAAGTGGTGGAGGTGAGGMGTPGAMKADGTCVANAFKHPANTGPCICQDNTPDVCPTVGCVDKMLDPANCGTCGMACAASATCNGGTCGPAPTALQPAIAACTAMTIAVNAGTVYYADTTHGTIGKVGATAPIAMGETGATLLALDPSNTNLFWYAAGTRKIRMVAAAGGTPTDVYADTAMGADGGAPPDVKGFLVTADAMIYISLDHQVLKAPVAGGTPTVVATEVKGGFPAALALNGTTNIVYPSTFNGDVDAPLLGVAGGAICGMDDPNSPGNAIMTTCPRLGRSQGELLPDFMAVIGGHAYWVDGQNIKGELIGALGTTFDAIASVSTNGITAATADATMIYVADADQSDPTNGFIEKTPVAPMSTLVTLARAQNAPVSIAVDATKVYWATADCAILSIAK